MKRAALFLSALLLPLGISSKASAQGTVTFGGATSGQTSAAAPKAPASSSSISSSSEGTLERALPAAGMMGTVPDDAEKEWAERDRKMNEGAALTGGVGLVHMQHAQGGAVGQFRVGFTTEYFSAGFLCTDSQPCRDPRNAGGVIRSDRSDHIGGHLTLSMQVLKWLEPYMATSAFADSNKANRPSLLQVLGDSTLGAKAHGALGKIFHVGGAFELWLVNGTGSVGLDGGGTGAKFRGLATADLRAAAKPIPVRLSTNMTYVLDNSSTVIEDTERTRGTSITRIERFGLGINRVDHFDVALGVEAFAAQEKVRPFLEYHVAIPVNRQNYRCKPTNPSQDLCLANEAVAPSSLTLGGRFFPWKRGFNALLALDIGVSGVGTFIEETKPEAPWMLYIGAGWAFDTQDRPPVIKERLIASPVAPLKPLGRKIAGFVHEEGKPDAVGRAIVNWENHSELTSLVTFPDGHFTTHELDEGTYVFGVKADGFKPGQCTATLVRASGRAAPGPLPSSQRGGLSPSQPTLAASTNSGSGDVTVDCPLVALPRVGVILGTVRDVDTQAPIAGAVIKIVDAAKDAGKKENVGTSDQNGAFRFSDVPLGPVDILANADGYLVLTDRVDVKARQDNPSALQMQKRPKTANVTVGKGEIFIKQQIQFAVDSATILPESNGLLSEISDVLIKNLRIKRVEVQGHTDNTGTPDHNKQLSEDRANSVVAWLATHGVANGRLTARGYGQSRPLVPNVTAGNRAKNRRVQFIISEQDATNPEAAPGPRKPAPKK